MHNTIDTLLLVNKKLHTRLNYYYNHGRINEKKKISTYLIFCQKYSNWKSGEPIPQSKTSNVSNVKRAKYNVYLSKMIWKSFSFETYFQISEIHYLPKTEV